jgi:orotate phosphoribosyltransferase
MTNDFIKQTSNLIELLFKTEAFQVCSEDKPFWYTSGTIGPYFINTHYLYGSKEKAEDLLSFIEENKEDKSNLSDMIFHKVIENYDEDDIYHKVIDTLVQAIYENEDVDTIDYISGGERRDWFFSLMVAYILKKPHLTIFKNKDTIVWDSTTRKQFSFSEGISLNGKNVIHVADLVTEASSYERAWIPSIKDLSGVMPSTYAVIDRMQGGKELLQKNDIRLCALVNIDVNLYEQALERGLINNEQLEMLRDYYKNPHGSMKEFLLKNPKFLQKTLEAGGKNAERAALCVENKIYG